MLKKFKKLKDSEFDKNIAEDRAEILYGKKKEEKEEKEHKKTKFLEFAKQDKETENPKEIKEKSKQKINYEERANLLYPTMKKESYKIKEKEKEKKHPNKENSEHNYIDEDFNLPLKINDIKDIKNLKNLLYYKKLNNKLDKEVGDFLSKNTITPKLYSNDIRHQYASALYTRNFGENYAKLLGDIGEFADLSSGGRSDTEIDKINNAIGREYGKKYRNLSKEELLKKLLNDHSINKTNRNKEEKKK